MATKRTTKRTTTTGAAGPSQRKTAARKTAAGKTSTRTGSSAGSASTGAPPRSASAGARSGFGAAMGSKMVSPEEAFKMYRTNAKIALDIIDAAIEETAKLRRFQFASEEDARSMQKRAARDVAEAGNPTAMLAASQTVTRDAMQKAMNYWREMFDLVVQIQKRLFSLLENHMEGVPGVKETKAALTMLPDLRQTQNLVSAMQGIMSSGGPAFATMQKAMGDLTRFSQGVAPSQDPGDQS